MPLVPISEADPIYTQVTDFEGGGLDIRRIFELGLLKLQCNSDHVC